ncbi:cytochrome c oxidase subunit IV [Cyathus striatus]|nr:cytochrome c oxidase subunit IV [Cyathus striatus]
MQVARLARAVPRIPLARRLATTTAAPADLAAASTSVPSRPAAAIPLSNVEAQWARLSSEERLAVHEQLEVVQKKDWKELSIDEKKAAYYVAFGPHGPREPSSKPGDSFKILLGTIAALAATGTLWFAIKAFPPPPRTINKEWEEASNERGKEMKLNPISGISSEGYTGKGFVHK